MKKKRVFYVLESFLKSNESSNNQQTETSIFSDSLSIDSESTRKNIDTSDELQITDAQKKRRQKWIDELQGKKNKDDKKIKEIEPIGNLYNRSEDKEVSNITPFNIDQGNLKGKFDFSFSVRGKKISIQQSDDLNANESDMQTSSQGQSGLQQEGRNNGSNMQGQQRTEQDSNNPSNGEPQNNPVKQLFSELDKISESIDKGHGFALSPFKIEDGQVPDSIINMLIDKFLNQRFLPTTTDLNTRRNSFNPDYGDLEWNIPDLVRHKVTKDLNKMLYDKYGFNDEDGKRRRYTIFILF